MSYTALYRKFRPGEFDEVKGQDHISQTLQNQIKANRIGHAYLFCGTRCDRIKILLKESDGITLLYKRLDVKGRFRWPRNASEVKPITWRQFDWLMSGLDIEQPKAIGNIK